MKINYGKMARSEFLDRYIQSQVERLTEVVKDPADLYLEIWVDVERYNSMKRKEYSTGIRMELPYIKNPMYIKKVDSNFFKAMKNLTESARAILLSVENKRKQTTKLTAHNF